MTADISVALYVWIALALLLIPLQLFVTAPYGRHSSTRWGPTLPNKVAWMSMEMVALLALWIPLVLWLMAGSPPGQLSLFAAGIWTLHYVYRALVYPLRTRTSAKRMPAVIMLFAMFFNGVNGMANGLYIAQGQLQGGSPAWIDPRTIVGLLIFSLGWYLNMRADNALLVLRKPHQTGYSIPRGGLFEWVSCPNFLGEIVQWCGFAILCWNLPSVAFAVWTVANLVPRALANHRWYQNTFVDYPTGRKAIFPGLL
jgi:hypothetical protein